ncbi:MAG: Na+/H+ antiporter [Anaerolineaceae bacterium]|jgi:CPA1 family monovalent cation:H+ antiporter|nr:Na+/H+ antiporter [Anaerolineaceae bacterium]
MEQFLNTETLIIELLLIASLVAIVVRRLHIPYTVALVVVGLFLTTQSPLNFELTPELILALFVPPLVFEAAFHLNLTELRRNLTSILMMAVPGVLLTTLIVGGIVSFGTGLSLPVALVFGSLVAATDPVAVVSLFRLLRVPKRLSVLVEGESLLNDGTALVLFNLMLAIVITGQFNLISGVLEFFKVSVGGVVVGLVLGWVVSRVIARIDDYLIEITLTTVLAYGSYLLAEQLHFSGVLAVVAAGLIAGSLGPQGMSPTTRIVLFNFWEYITFLVNSLVFLLIGLDVDLFALFESWQFIAWAIGAVLVARVVVVYGLGWVSNRLGEPISLRWRHVIAWGGLRGALSLALALSLPVAFGEERYLLRAMAFGVALFTLLIQATTMRPLVRKLGIITTTPVQVEYEQRHARLNALRSAEAHIERRYREGLISTPAWERIKPKLHTQTALLADSVRQLLKVEPKLETEELELARREILRAQRSAYLGMRGDGVISEEIFETLTAEIDAALENEDETFWYVPQESLPNRLNEGLSGSASVSEIVIEAGAACDGQQVMNIEWPKHFVIASVKRGSQVIIPKGDTTLKANDLLTMVGDEASIEEAKNFLRSS